MVPFPTVTIDLWLRIAKKLPDNVEHYIERDVAIPHPIYFPINEIVNFEIRKRRSNIFYKNVLFNITKLYRNSTKSNGDIVSRINI